MKIFLFGWFYFFFFNCYYYFSAPDSEDFGSCGQAGAGATPTTPTPLLPDPGPAAAERPHGARGAGGVRTVCAEPGGEKAASPRGRAAGGDTHGSGATAGDAAPSLLTPHPPDASLLSLCPAVRRAAPLRRHGGGGHPHHHVRGPPRRPPHAARPPPQPRAAAPLAPVPPRRPRQRHGPRHGRLRQRRPQER